MADQGAAREEVVKCEQEIQSIKGALRRLGTSEKDGEPNSMEIVVLKVEGLPEAAKPIFSLQLSSPIEDGILGEIHDPLNNDPAPEGSLLIFKGVETTVATLTLSAKDADIPLGSSAPHDLAPLCLLDAMDIKDQYVTELPVAIVAEGQSAEIVQLAETDVTEDTASAEAGEETKEQAAKTEGDNKKEEEATAEAQAVAIQPVCTVTIRVTYKPSPKDQREELYEMLNKTSQRKATALDHLRKISMAMTTRGGGSSPTKSSTTVVKPSVKPGFLNKKKKEPSRMEKVYERTLGPNSLLRRGFGVAVFAKNYIMFFGAVTFFHFKGQLLALPPPV